MGIPLEEWRFRGSLASKHLNRPIVGAVRYGDGYLMIGADGGVFPFAHAPTYGGLGGFPIAAPVTSVAGIG